MYNSYPPFGISNLMIYQCGGGMVGGLCINMAIKASSSSLVLQRCLSIQ
jgi:hypothetical protein